MTRRDFIRRNAIGLRELDIDYATFSDLIDMPGALETEICAQVDQMIIDSALEAEDLARDIAAHHRDMARAINEVGKC